MKVKELIEVLKKFDPESPVDAREKHRGTFANPGITVRWSSRMKSVAIEGTYTDNVELPK